MAGCSPKGRMAQLEKPAKQARSLSAVQRDHAVVTARGARTVARRLAAVGATRRGMEASASMRGGKEVASGNA
jgi:hypothetical protein